MGILCNDFVICFFCLVIFRSSDMEKVENCFLHVFFKHWRASSVFLMVTEALTLLITIDEAVKIRTANKGTSLSIFLCYCDFLELAKKADSLVALMYDLFC